MNTRNPGPTPYLLGVDIGTSSTTAVLTTTGGHVLARAVRPHGVERPVPGWAEHDAETVWWAEFCSVVARLRAVAQEHDGEIASVAVSGIGPVAVIADESGTPLRPAILYGIDTRAMPEAEELNSAWGLGELNRRAGSHALGADAVAPKLLWLARHEPETFAAARRYFLPQSFIGFRLTGRYVVDVPSAPDPFWDPASGQWNTDWWHEICPSIDRPEPVWPGESIGVVTASGAQASGLAPGTVVAAGTRDSFADAVSVGLSYAGDAVIIYGSTMSMIALTREAGGPFVRPGLRHVGAAMATSGALTAWLRDLVGGVEFAELVAEAEQSPPGARGLLVLPYFAGERSPLADPDARGVICGLTLSHTRADLYRAVLEGTAFGLRHCLDELPAESSGAMVPFAVGGGTTSTLWPQIVSDVIGRPQQLTAGATGACVGDAILAGLASGLVSPEDRWITVLQQIEPDQRVAGLYRERYELYRQLHEQTVAIQHQLAQQAKAQASSRGV